MRSLLSRRWAGFKNHVLCYSWFYTVSGLSLFVFLVFSYFSYRKFMFPMLDLGLFNRHMWDMMRGDFGPNSLKVPTQLNLLGDHAHFILLLLAPVYALFQDPFFLVMVQVITLVVSSYPIYKLALKQGGDKRVAAFWLVPYFMFFGFWSGLAYPFHEIFLALPLIAWALYYLLEDQFKPMVVCLGLLLLVKENMSLLVIMFGIYVIVMRKQYKKGSALISVSAIYFVAVTQYWLPWFSHGPDVYADNVFGTSTLDVVRAAVQTPKEFVKQLFLPLDKTKSMVFMLASFGGLPIIGIEILILLSPLWLGRFLSTQPWRWSVIQHYSVDQGPILAVAAIIGAYRLHSLLCRHGIKLSKQTLGCIAISLCVIGSIAVHLRIDERYPWRLMHPSFYTQSKSDKAAWKAVALVPKSASVAAQAAFPQLSSRREIYNLPIDLSKYRPQYIVASENYDMWPFGDPNELSAYIQSAQVKQGYKVIYSEYGATVLRRQ